MIMKSYMEKFIIIKIFLNMILYINLKEILKIIRKKLNTQMLNEQNIEDFKKSIEKIHIILKNFLFPAEIKDLKRK